MHCKKSDCRFKSIINTNTQICYYMGITGRPRGCRPTECDKYEKAKNKRKSNQADILISHDPENIKEYWRIGNERKL